MSANHFQNRTMVLLFVDSKEYQPDINPLIALKLMLKYGLIGLSRGQCSVLRPAHAGWVGHLHTVNEGSASSPVNVELCHCGTRIGLPPLGSHYQYFNHGEDVACFCCGERARRLVASSFVSVELFLIKFVPD